LCLLQGVRFLLRPHFGRLAMEKMLAGLAWRRYGAWSQPGGAGADGRPPASGRPDAGLWRGRDRERAGEA